MANHTENLNIRLCLAAVALLACLATGCQQRGLAQKRMEARLAGINETAETLAKREQKSPQRLAHAADFVDRDVRKDADALGRDFARVKAYLDRDLRRWQERQPEYWDKTERILRGKPETIERTAILLFI